MASTIRPDAPSAFVTFAQAARLYWSRWILRKRGLGAAIAWATPRVIAGARSPRSPSPETITRSVAIAAAFVPGYFRCLEQSLVLCHALRMCGYAAELKIGATAYAFRAHAWIELNGVPLNELPERVRLYKSFTLPTHA
jgi:hypothetical protein